MMKKLRIYKEYLKYILEHKKNVFKVCWEKKMYLHAITHDLSKFNPVEFFPYAEWFYGEYGTTMDNRLLEIPYSAKKQEDCKRKFNKAWEHHYKHNKHHWNYWIGTNMPLMYVKHMICDWEAMSIKFGDTPQEFYMNNYDNMAMTYETRLTVESELGLIDIGLGLTWKEYCRKTETTMKEDLKRLGYIK